MKLKSLDTGNILKIFLWAAIILSLSIFVTTLIYSLWYDFYLKIELVDMFLESVFSILLLMMIIIYLVWIFNVHQDLKELIPSYPISPWGAIRRITIPFYNIYGLWAVYSTLKGYLSYDEKTKKLGIILGVYIPIYYFLHWTSNIFDSFIKRSFAMELMGEQFFNYVAASYALNAGVFTSYLLILMIVTKSIPLLSKVRTETSELEVMEDPLKIENASPSLPEYPFLSEPPIIKQSLGIKP
ncbi:hypothetical protein [Paenisporosarcina cavernae]|uniref:DUF4328 domain-containing protein n=1 Tax=Paenisporosarcina cavernae TaxID=2320858 RepID=A0A385YU16_9BACL|nr:hypothetical protein [Paenisporosarcina cavernae]AYC29981.1 hypothetical protein D3873_08875 [Paenisporosarcina cavernae]